MESEKVTAVTIVSIPKAEMYEVKDNKEKKVDSGPLQIVHVSEMNCFLLVLNNFKYSLNSDLPVFGSSQPGSGLRSYVFPSLGGFYVFRIKEVPEEQILHSFEMILANHCEFAEQTDEEDDNEEDQKVKGGQDDGHKKTKTEYATDALYKGGELLKTGLMKGAELLSKGINKGGNFIKTKFMKKKADKEVSEDTLKRMEVANKATGTVLTITKTAVTGLITIGKSIGSEVARTWSKGENGKKVTNYKYYGQIKQVGTATLNFGAQVYQGMFEAICTIARGFGDTTTDLVTHKYGEKAGKATKDGVDTAANIGVMTRVITFEATKAVGEATKKKDGTEQTTAKQ